MLLHLYRVCFDFVMDGIVLVRGYSGVFCFVILFWGFFFFVLFWQMNLCLLLGGGAGPLPASPWNCETHRVVLDMASAVHRLWFVFWLHRHLWQWSEVSAVSVL